MRWVGALTAAGLALTGCGTDDKTTTAPTTAQAAAPWDACSIPDTLIRQAGLDPATKNTSPTGAQWQGAKDCGWQGKEAGVTVVSNNTGSLEQVRNKYGNRDFVTVSVDGRTGMQYHDGSDTDDSCVLVFAVRTGGLVGFLILRNPLSKDRTPACEQLRPIASMLVPAFPA